MKVFLGIIIGLVLAGGALLPQTRLKHDQTYFTQLDIYGTPPESRVFIMQGPAPASTVTDDGTLFDAVVYLDSADGKLKILKRSGVIVQLEP